MGNHKEESTKKVEPAKKSLWVMVVALGNNTIGFYGAKTYTKSEAKKYLGLRRLPAKTPIRKNNDFGIKGIKIRMID